MIKSRQCVHALMEKYTGPKTHHPKPSSHIVYVGRRRRRLVHATLSIVCECLCLPLHNSTLAPVLHIAQGKRQRLTFNGNNLKRLWWLQRGDYTAKASVTGFSTFVVVIVAWMGKKEERMCMFENSPTAPHRHRRLSLCHFLQC